VAINKVIDTKLAATSNKKEKVNELYLNAGTDKKEDPQIELWLQHNVGLNLDKLFQLQVVPAHLNSILIP
jgi:hypothetical protein